MHQDKDVSFFPIVGLLMLFLQFGQLKGPTPRGPSKATLGHSSAQKLPRCPAYVAPSCKPCFVKYHFPRMTHTHLN